MVQWRFLNLGLVWVWWALAFDVDGVDELWFCTTFSLHKNKDGIFYRLLFFWLTQLHLHTDQASKRNEAT